MSGYRITFFKNLVNSQGHRFKCPQKVIVVQHARSPDRAMQAAKLRYARSLRVHDWRLHADLTELASTEDKSELAVQRH